MGPTSSIVRFTTSKSYMSVAIVTTTQSPWRGGSCSAPPLTSLTIARGLSRAHPSPRGVPTPHDLERGYQIYKKLLQAIEDFVVQIMRVVRNKVEHKGG